MGVVVVVVVTAAGEASEGCGVDGGVVLAGVAGAPGVGVEGAVVVVAADGVDGVVDGLGIDGRDTFSLCRSDGGK